ncbi:hypothetical protein HD806DRAFT_302783 [Xylariaceae sp. AK1471]|nr:hypothetical protein HD806DRAFT_302783 [Xylariaceae sp. AK1471]
MFDVPKKFRALRELCDSPVNRPWKAPKRAKTIDRFRPDNDQLKALLRSRDLDSFVFVVISVLPRKDKNCLGEIGLSIWYPGQEYDQQNSLHWVIKEERLLGERDSHDWPIFYFGDTEYIKISEIGALLQDEISSLQHSASHVVIVGHGIERVLNWLQDFWYIPNGVKIIDTQKVWQFQHQKMGDVPLIAALETIPAQFYDKQLLGNAGNEARFTLELLKTLGQESKEHRGPNK